MWAADLEMAKAIADQLVKLSRAQEYKPAPAPEPPPRPFVPEPIPKNESYIESLQRKNRDAVRSGKAGDRAWQIRPKAATAAPAGRARATLAWPMVVVAMNRPCKIVIVVDKSGQALVVDAVLDEKGRLILGRSDPTFHNTAQNRRNATPETVEQSGSVHLPHST